MLNRPQLAALVILINLSLGCSESTKHTSFDHLLPAVTQNDQTDSKRLAVFDQITAQNLTPDQNDRLCDKLAEIVGSPRHSPVIRERAITLLADHCPQKISPLFADALLTTSEPEIRQLLLNYLNRFGDTRAIPSLLTALDDAPPTDKLTNSPIAQTIQKIAPAPLPDHCLTALTDPKLPLAARIAAVSLLTKAQSPADTLKTIAALKPGDPMIDTLRFWASRFEFIPTNTPRLFACQMQITTLPEPQWQSLADRIKIINQHDNERLDPRDTHLLLNIDPALLNLTRTELAQPIAARLAQLDHAKRPPSYPNAHDDYSENFDPADTRLTFPDLLRLKLLLDSLADAKSVTALSQLLKSNTPDSRSELGGLCLLANNAVTFKPYAPNRSVGSNQYIEPAAMTIDAPLALARWHTHNNPDRGLDLAGPGLDDLNFAKHNNACSLVITKLNDTMINVDYYSPDGIVIDLGIYKIVGNNNAQNSKDTDKTKSISRDSELTLNRNATADTHRGCHRL